MSLRGAPIEEPVTLPDGRTLLLRIGVPDDPYVPKRELSTVVVEALEDGRGVAAVTTVLTPDDTSEARTMLRELVDGLASGSVAPTASAIETVVDRPRT